MSGMMGEMGPKEGHEMRPEMWGMGMMKMMESMLGKGFNPEEMCRQMVQVVTKAAEMGSYATPEVRALFEDWVEDVEKDILEFIKTKGEVEPKDIASHLRIKEESVLFFITRLARQGKVRITGIRAG